MRYKDFHGGKKNPYSPAEELVIKVDHISILQGSSNYFTGSQEQSLSIEQVEMLWGLETGGFRLCYYRSVSVKANQQAVNSPALANCAEFVLEKQIITVTCGADEFSNITPHGFLSLFILFLQELEFFNLFALLDPPEKEVIYSTGQKIQTVIASIAVGCTYNSDINHQLVPYTVEAELLGLKRFPDQSQISRFLRHMTNVSLSQMAIIFSLAAHYYSLTSMLPVKVDIDIDSTGLIANGRTYQLNRKGYFSKRRGEKGYQLSMCIAALTGDVLAHSFMPGNHSAPADFIDLIYGAAEVLGSFDRLGIIRADAGYGKSENLDFLIDHELQFVVKGCNHRSFSDMVPFIPPTEWEYVSNTISVHDAGDKTIPKSKSKNRARIIMIKQITTKGKVAYAHIYTSLPWDAVDVFEYYSDHQCIEAIIRTDKSYLNIKNLRTRDFCGIASFLYLAFMTHNMLNLFRKAVLEPLGITDIGLRNIVRKLMHVPAKVIKEVSIISLLFPSKHFYTVDMLSEVHGTGV